MIKLNQDQIESVNGGLWQFVAGYAGGKLIDGLIYCENNWSSGDYGYGTYNQLMGRCMTDPATYGWQ